MSFVTQTVSNLYEDKYIKLKRLMIGDGDVMIKALPQEGARSRVEEGYSGILIFEVELTNGLCHIQTIDSCDALFGGPGHSAGHVKADFFDSNSQLSKTCTSQYRMAPSGVRRRSHAPWSMPGRPAALSTAKSHAAMVCIRRYHQLGPPRHEQLPALPCHQRRPRWPLHAAALHQHGFFIAYVRAGRAGVADDLRAFG